MRCQDLVEAALQLEISSFNLSPKRLNTAKRALLRDSLFARIDLKQGHFWRGGRATMYFVFFFIVSLLTFMTHNFLQESLQVTNSWVNVILFVGLYTLIYIICKFIFKKIGKDI